MGNERSGFRPAHPGRIIRRNIEAMGMTQEDFAGHIGKTRQTVSAIIAGRSAATADVAARLAKAFGTSTEVWLNLQSKHDAWDAERAPEVQRVKRITFSGGRWAVQSAKGDRVTTKHKDKAQAITAGSKQAKATAGFNLAGQGMHKSTQRAVAKAKR